MAEVVPLRRPGTCEPAERDVEQFCDAADPDRILSLTWGDERRLRLTIDVAGNGPVAFCLEVGDALDLVRAIVDGLPSPNGPAGDPATVLPFRPGNEPDPRPPL